MTSRILLLSSFIYMIFSRMILVLIPLVNDLRWTELSPTLGNEPAHWRDDWRSLTPLFWIHPCFLSTWYIPTKCKTKLSNKERRKRKDYVLLMRTTARSISNYSGLSDSWPLSQIVRLPCFMLFCVLLCTAFRSLAFRSIGAVVHDFIPRLASCILENFALS